MKSVKCLYRTLVFKIRNAKYKEIVKKWDFSIVDTNETIDYIVRNKVSVSRFGDGEYRIMHHSCNGFQRYDRMLSERLKEVLYSISENHIVCIPYAFKNDGELTYKARKFWHRYIVNHRNFIGNITPKRVFFDASFTRFYIDNENKTHVPQIVHSLKRIWENRNLYIIEGEFSRLGVGNDLFDNAKSVKRVLCPAENAFEEYDKILMTVKRLVPVQDSLVLCALGMTATILAYDLSQLGYWAIDIGHIDVEYCWYKMGAKEKCAIPGKHVHEVKSYITDVCNDLFYNQSILVKICKSSN